MRIDSADTDLPDPDSPTMPAVSPRSRRGCAPRARRYATIDAACGALGISRSSFYRWLEAPGSSLAEHVVRVPPVTGRIRVDLTGIEELLRREQLGAGDPATEPQR